MRELKSLTTTVPASQKVLRSENYIELDRACRIVRAHVYFPPGCQNLVEVTMGAGDVVFAPKIISGDGKSVSFEVDLTIGPKTPIWAEVANYDAANEHTPTIEVELELLEEAKIV